MDGANIKHKQANVCSRFQKLHLVFPLRIRSFYRLKQHNQTALHPELLQQHNNIMEGLVMCLALV